MTYKPKYVRSSPLKKINYREFKPNDLNIISKVLKEIFKYMWVSDPDCDEHESIIQNKLYNTN